MKIRQMGEFLQFITGGKIAAITLAPFGIYVLKGEDTAYQIDNVFDVAFRLQPTITHNDLTYIQDAPDNVTGEHYHISSAQATVVSNTSGTNTGDKLSWQYGGFTNANNITVVLR